MTAAGPCFAFAACLGFADGSDNIISSMFRTLAAGVYVFVAIAAVTLGAVVWAAFIRRRRRRHHHSHHHRQVPQTPPAPAPAPQPRHRGWFFLGRHKPRRRKLRRRPNPTLAETGGLPPLRPPAPEESPSPRP